MMICKGFYTSKKGKPPCDRNADLQCKGCGYVVCYLHSGYVCDCPVTMGERRGLEINSQGVM